MITWKYPGTIKIQVDLLLVISRGFCEDMYESSTCKMFVEQPESGCSDVTGV